MTTSLSTAKKSASERRVLDEEGGGGVRCAEAGGEGHYEEAWDLRMARLGIDLEGLSCLLSGGGETTEARAGGRGDENNCERMMHSCIDRVERTEHSPLIRMTSSLIEHNVMANNPVYSFKPFEATKKSVKSSGNNNNILHSSEVDGTLKPLTPEGDQPAYDHSCDTATLRPRFKSGILLNNTCYELAPSQLVSAIIDHGHDSQNIRLSRMPPSAFKPLWISQSRNDQASVAYNNHCYTSMPVPTLSSTLKTNLGYSRQVSAPVYSATEVSPQMSHPNLDYTSQTLQLQSSRHGLKSVKPINSVHHAGTWTLKGRCQADQQSDKSNRTSNSFMSKSMITDDSRLSDNYIKHLTGQEIAGNFIKHSQRPECHIQRTEDRYHMGLNDSRLDMIADSNRPLEEHLWYHPFLSRMASEQLLAKYPEGSFLVRRSESCSDEYSLSIRYKQKWLHMKISRDNDGQFVLGQYSQPYPSIPIMIRHYSCSFLPVKGANLISLQQPVFRL